MFYQIFKDLCIKKGVKPGRAATEIGISRAAVTNWKKNGYSPRHDVLLKIAEYFGVTVSYLLGEDLKEEPSQFNEEQNEREELSIEEILERTKRQLESQEGLMFEGGVAPKEAIDSILAAMEVGLQIAKSKTKEEREAAAKIKASILEEADRIERQG